MKKHKWLDKPVPAYFLLLIFVVLMEQIGIIFDMILGIFLQGFGVENYSAGLFAALASLWAASIFKNKMLKGEFTGFLCKDNLKTGLMMVLPLTLFHMAGSCISIAEVGTGNFLYAILACLAPGFGEEIAFRGCGVANYMRTRRREEDIPLIFYLSGIVFGGIHITNIFMGGDTVACIIQSVYAAGIGLFLGAVYLRTGNLWPTIICHCLVDFAELMRADLYASNGAMTGTITGDYVTIVGGIIGGFIGIYMIRKAKRAEIIEVWNRKFPQVEGPAEQDSEL